MVRSNQPVKDGSHIIVKVMCAVIFVLFSALWLYYFQADLMAVTQHVLSKGQTVYHRAVGTVIITLALLLLQVVVLRVIKLYRSNHALTYFPSMLLLAILTSGFPEKGSAMSISYWYWLAPLLLALWGAVVWIICSIRPYLLKTALGFYARVFWINTLEMALMIVGVNLTANTNAVYHYRAHMETCLMKQQFDEALTTGRRSLETDASLTMLRAYALSRKGELGERLFEYPVAGSGADLVPLSGCRSRWLIYPSDSLYRHLGAIPRPGMDTPAYLSALERGGQAKKAVGDYVLCGMLIDRNLDDFACTIGKYYDVADSLSLPRHYREALTLYVHQRSNPVVVYHHPVTEEDYRDLQELEAQYTNPTERKVRVMEKYQGSYWYYFEYVR